MASRRTTIADHLPMGPGRGLLAGQGRAENPRSALFCLVSYLQPDRFGMLGVAMLVLLTTALALICPYLMGRAIDRYTSRGELGHLARVVGLMIGLYLLAAAVTWVQTIWMIRIAQRAVASLRRDLFGKLQVLPLASFDGRPRGELMSRLTNDTDIVSSALGDSVTQFLSSTLSVLGAGYVMFALNWRLTLATLVTFPGVALAARWIGRRTRAGFRARQQALGELNGLIEETVQGQRAIIICQRSREFTAKFTAANEALKGSAVQALIAVGLMGPVMQVFRNLGFAVLAATGTWLVTKDLATVGTIAAFMAYADSFNRPLMQLASLYGAMQSALAGAERVFALLDEAPETDASGAVNLPNVQGEVEFSQVDFSYLPGVPVLTGVSFHATPGQSFALVGPTGAGKTTIVSLLARFYDVDAGVIRVDGHDVRSVRRESLRRALGVVLQDTFLFTDTVRENLRYGRPSATDSEVEEAARLANAESFIRHLPQGYDTVLADAGSSLSQGQRQLLAIARALLVDPAILVLDEATSSVDTRTEMHVQQAMRHLMAGRTSFVIAHRLSTIQQADCILLIDHGRVIERGTHEELLAKRGAYRRLHGRRQQGQIPASTRPRT
jgi:ATP-binding cassette subfamily B multidrug efflux pump